MEKLRKAIRRLLKALLNSQTTQVAGTRSVDDIVATYVKTVAQLNARSMQMREESVELEAEMKTLHSRIKVADFERARAELIAGKLGEIMDFGA